MYRKILAVASILTLVLSCCAYGAASMSYSGGGTATGSVLPKRGDVAVLVEGSDDQQKSIAEVQIVNSLTAHGYRVVDEKKMKAMKMAAVRAQAARLAAQGNFSAIFKLNASYSVGATIVAHIQAGQPTQNQFKLYTGDATAAIMAATSGGVTLGGRTAMSKQVGYSAYEAQMKAIQAAVEDGMSQLYQ